jgi:hypothetical protein
MMPFARSVLPMSVALAATVVAVGAACGSAPPQPVRAAPASTIAPSARAADHLVVWIRGSSVGVVGRPAPLADLTAPAAPTPAPALGGGSLMIAPLADALDEARRAGRLGDRLEVVLDPETPYEALVRVLFTAGQREVWGCDLREDRRGGRALSFDFPEVRAPSSPIDRDHPPLHLSALVVSAGVALKVSSGNIAPGCDHEDAGVAIPRTDAGLDLAALRACAVKLKALRSWFADEHTVTLSANPATPFREVMDVAVALRGDDGALFPRVQFGVVR